ncbi:MAG: S8 family serine peptidase [Bdellovibrionaceae bacterium]|nr:S8 family serine peptidase [Pseudobdellovibrionaceae bacterium]
MKVLTALLLIISAMTVEAQQIRPRVGQNVTGEFVVRFQGAYNPQYAVAALQAQGLQVKEVISPTLNMYLVKGKSSTQEALGTAYRVKGVAYAQPNHYVFLRQSMNFTRGLPTDPHFKRQWDMIEGSGISANLVWNTTTGGKDKGGKDIVVAVIDGGFDLTHEDLRENIWVNNAEIANNGKDDDGNGFVDDKFGWNAGNNSGNITSDDHGTHVMGTIGARGANGRGIVGVNWNVKIMPVQGGQSLGTTATVAKAYGYVIEQKKLWFQSKGQKGANIVATNSSFGVDGADCKTGEFPIWNDLYEQMGQLGILSAAATANSNVNVDRDGDVPTGCASNFIVTVTNTNKENSKYPQAGYGANTIDLGAPGTDILSTLPKNQYGILTGTSMATPHVAGSIALIHAAANEAFIQKYYTQPAKAALLLKQALLATVDPLPSLKGVTVSGGRLNVGKAVQALNAARLR